MEGRWEAKEEESGDVGEGKEEEVEEERRHLLKREREDRGWEEEMERGEREEQMWRGRRKEREGREEGVTI